MTDVRVPLRAGGLECVLCARTIHRDDGLALISLASRRSVQQGFFAHATCFKAVMHASTADMLDLDDVPSQAEDHHR